MTNLTCTEIETLRTHVAAHEVVSTTSCFLIGQLIAGTTLDDTDAKQIRHHIRSYQDTCPTVCALLARLI